MNQTGYKVFTRSWWKANPNWPDGREPHAGKRRILRRNLTLEEARTLCANWNAKHGGGALSVKAEFERQ